MANNILTPEEDYIQEDLEKFKERYSGFGQEIYERINEILPNVFNHLTYYKGKTFQKEDSYAVYDDHLNAFGIQLDPLSEVIVLWNNQVQIEIGTWSKDEYLEAINFIKTKLIK